MVCVRKLPYDGENWKYFMYCSWDHVTTCIVMLKCLLLEKQDKMSHSINISETDLINALCIFRGTLGAKKVNVLLVFTENHGK